jgi:hypothetical protein
MLKQNLIKKVKFNNLKKIYWLILKEKKFLIVTTKYNIKKYILFPNDVLFFKQENIFFIKQNQCSLFYKKLEKWLQHFYKPLQKKIFFKGLGFKFKYSTNKKSKLELKLGFSHLTTITIPRKEIKVFLIKKNRIAIEGFNYTLVGNFAEKIRNLRYPDAYTGKGFWYKNEFKKLKLVKKT